MSERQGPVSCHFSKFPTKLQPFLLDPAKGVIRHLRLAATTVSAVSEKNLCEWVAAKKRLWEFKSSVMVKMNFVCLLHACSLQVPQDGSRIQ